MLTRQNPKSSYPPPRRRSTEAVRKSLRRHVRGKPTHAANRITLTRLLGTTVKRSVMSAVLLVVIAGFLVAGFGGGLLIGYILTTEPVTASQLNNRSETTRIFDSDGKEIAILTGAENINREFVAIGKVKGTYIDEAFKAIEDERFDEHLGIDPKRIGSAVLSALTNGGTATHGGSTITQQTVKLVSGANERSAQRKIQEWYNAMRLEQQKSKDEIMELYINLVPMGNSYVGLQSAAKGYFNKDASELSLVECAFLAGIPNRPSSYNPLTETGRRNAMRRMRIVLGKMHDTGMIDEDQFRIGLDTELVFRNPDEAISGSQINSYFADYTIGKVIDDLVARRGYSRSMAELAVYNQGLRIESTMSSRIQNDMEETFRTESLFIRKPEAVVNLPSKPQGSMVVVENYPNPGQIKGMVGGFGEKIGNFVLNRAVSARRQPGSSIKPLGIYGPGIDTGRITAASVFTDQPYHLNPDKPTQLWPKNSDPDYRGNLTIRESVKYSVNTIAAYLWTNAIGPDTMLSYLGQLGMPRPTERYVSTSLGSFNQGMTTLEMAGAYTVWANQGLFTPPYAYTRVLDAGGRVLLENKPEFKQVFKPETAFVMTNIMQGVMTPGGTANGNAVPGMPSAGKTGTTDDNADKWLVGFTPYYSAAVWYGYDNRLGKTVIPREDRNNARGIWTDAMTRIHKGLRPREFARPATVQEASICPQSGQLATSACPNPHIEYFVPGAAMNPKNRCPIHGGSTLTPMLPDPAIPGASPTTGAPQPPGTAPTSTPATNPTRKPTKPTVKPTTQSPTTATAAPTTAAPTTAAPTTAATTAAPTTAATTAAPTTPTGPTKNNATSALTNASSGSSTTTFFFQPSLPATVLGWAWTAL